ncbi:MAG: septum formation protein Maf [Paludibacteraceae bacterium]|nr:septum formation protein Maf [Paludibacteraceae bacterium]
MQSSIVKLSIILGSQSPRRRELMAGLDLPFTAITIDADETYPANLQAGDIPYYISRAKARAYAPNLTADQLLITADTIVWLDGQMLGKPHDEAEAISMLRRLSGKTHQVYTAVTFAENSQKLITNSQQPVLSTLVDKTDVTFRELSDEEIAYYVEHYRPLDKAGAYGVQEWIGYVACTGMRGSYFNVMGFPVHLVYQELKNRGVI